jgi:hypothetical protein
MPGPDRLLRLLLPAGTAGFVVVVERAGADFHPLPVTVALLLAVAAAVLPDGAAPLFLVLLLVALWGLTVPEQLGPLTVLAASDLVVIHVAAALAAHGPAGLRVHRGLAVLWGWRILLMAATAAAVAVVGSLLTGLRTGATPAVATGLAVVVVWAGFLLARLGVLTPAPEAERQPRSGR